MNQQQEKIQELIEELIDAAEREGSPESWIQWVLKGVPGILDGSFFDLPPETQRGSLGWLHGVFFGKGESANGMLDSGLLRPDFPRDYYEEIRKYTGSFK